MHTRHARTRVRPRRGFTLVEAVISIAIVGSMLVAALSAMAGSQRLRIRSADRLRGHQLAADLIAEVEACLYTDPGFGLGSFGVGADETGPDRSLFDDVDDYDGWSASPPQRKDGAEIPDLDGWTRTVEVEWVLPDDLGDVQGGESEVKRVVVTVLDGDAVVAQLTTIRTAGADEVN